MAARKVTHVIFDMDGLLLDTESFYTTVQQNLLKPYNKEFTWELKSKMMGQKALEAARVLVRELQLEDVLTPEQFVDMREAELDKLFPQTQLMPGAARLVRHLHSNNVPICLATSSHKRHFDLKTTLHRDLFALFDHRITGDQVVKGKPAPDIFLLAASRFPDNPPPAACLVFEDAPVGVAAARAAGMPVIMVPDAKLNRDLAKEADLVLPSLEAFDPVPWGLPPFPEPTDPAQDGPAHNGLSH